MGTAPGRRTQDPPARGAGAPPGSPDRRAARPGRRRPVPPFLRDWRFYVGVVALVVAIVLAVTAFGDGGEEDRPPAADAARLVPADALAFVTVSTDEGRPAVRRALALLERFGADSALRGQLTGLLRSGDDAGAPLDVGREVAPWLGDEAALAITRGRGTTAGSLMLLAVADKDLGDARAFLARGAGTARRSQYRGVELTSYRNGTVTAAVDGFLAIGQNRSVRAAIDLAAAGDGDAARSLADDAVYRRAVAGAPEARVAEAYASVDGVRRLLAPQPGLLGLAGAMLDQRGLRGTALALTTEEGAARFRVHAVLDPRDRTAAPRFEPTLTEVVPRDAVAYAGFAGLERAAPALLGLSGLTGLGGDTGELLTQAGRVLREGGIDVARDVLPLFGAEVAVVAVPTDGVPAIALLTRTDDAAATRAALTRLEPAIARLFAPAGGAAPAWEAGRAGETPIRRLAAEGVELDYALLGDTVALATSAAAIAAVARPDGSIGDNPAYRATVSDSNENLTSVVFFDFGQLLSMFEGMGLTGGLGGDGAAADLERVRAVGLTSTSEETQSTAELTLEIP